MDLYPEVRRQLEDANCHFVAMIRPGVEGWFSPRMGASFTVDMKLTRFRGAGQAFNGGFSDAQDASALFT